MKNKKRLIKILILLFIIIIASATTLKIIANKADVNLQKLELAEIKEINLTKIENGTYTGTYKTFPIEVEVQVVVHDHKIINIDLIKHTNGKGKDAEVIPAKVIETQNLKVDMISGATYSSKSILLAIQDALNK